jgi:hypothetical protein
MSVQTPWRLDNQVSVASAISHHPDAATAIADLAQALGDEAALFAVFVAPGYDLDAAGAAIQQWCGGRVIGCTSSGSVGPRGYDPGGIFAISLTGGGLRTRTISVGALTDPSRAERAAVDLSGLHKMWEGADGFGVLLADGLTKREDRLAAVLMAALGDVPIIGGSAGDDLTFTRTAVFCDGRFVDDGATFTMVTLDAPFQIFRLQHYEPTDVVLVATDAVPDQRLIREFNGRSAAEAYAEAVGLSVDALNPTVFSTHPLMLLAAGTTWVRSISEVHADGSLGTLAAVDVGEVLRVGRPEGMITKLEARFAEVTAELGQIGGVFAFDCVLRRLEFEELGMDKQVGDILARNKVVGFSTYGEQFNGMHMNQTLVAVAFGTSRQGTG